MSNHAHLPLSALDLNEAARPKGPRFDGPAPAQNADALKATHRFHRFELSKARRVLTYIKTGTTTPDRLAEALAEMPLTENMAQFGSICGSECRALEFHHNAEEYSMFPSLEDHQIAEVNAIVAKLRAEHEIVHELLRRLGIAAQNLTLAPSDDTLAKAEAVFDALETVVASHFSYEETELAASLDHLAPAI